MLLVISYIFFMLEYGVLCVCVHMHVRAYMYVCMCVCTCVHVHICSWRTEKRLWVSYSVTYHLIPLRRGLSEPRVQAHLNCQPAKSTQLFSLNPAVVLGNRCRCWNLNSRPQACTASVYTCWTICLPPTQSCSFLNASSYKGFFICSNKRCSILLCWK